MHSMFQVLHVYVAYVVFHMLHEMLIISMFNKLCEFKYENLLKQLKFG
jgi:hypothetical protein